MNEGAGGPPSSVLDRVKMFLPQIAQANVELEKKMAGEGLQSVVIDKDIVAEDSSEDEEEEEVSILEYEGVVILSEGMINSYLFQNDNEKKAESGAESGPTIKLNFALGDFDQHPIALAEEDKDEKIDDNQLESSDSDDDIDTKKNHKVDNSIFRIDK